MPSTSQLQTQLIELVTKARRVDLRTLEDSAVAEIHAGVVPVVRELVGGVLDVFGRIIKAHDGISDVTTTEFRLPVGGRFERLVEGMMHSTSAHRVVDLCFVGGFELRPLYQRLLALDEGDFTTLVRLLGSVIRKLVRAATAVENAFAESRGLTPVLCYTSLLEIALKTRRAYAKLRRGISGGAGVPARGELRHRLTSAATAIAALRGDDVYGELRFADRAELISLQKRVIAWMAASNDAAREDGRHLWQDLVAFAQLLRGINRRPELVEHDRAKVAEARRLADTEPWQLVAKLGAWDALWGLDDELDALIETGEAADPERVRAVLQQLDDRLAPSRVGGEISEGCAEPEEPPVQWSDLLDDRRT